MAAGTAAVAIKHSLHPKKSPPPHQHQGSTMPLPKHLGQAGLNGILLLQLLPVGCPPSACLCMHADTQQGRQIGSTLWTLPTSLFAKFWFAIINKQGSGSHTLSGKVRWEKGQQGVEVRFVSPESAPSSGKCATKQPPPSLELHQISSAHSGISTRDFGRGLHACSHKNEC